MALGDVILESGFNRLKRCRYGYMLYNRNDLVIGQSLDLYGESGEAELKACGQVLRRGCVVVDAGANIGTHTLFFARAVGDDGMVVAIEPQRVLFQTLCANIALNSLTNVHCHHAALGASAGTIFVPPLDYTKPLNYGGIGFGRWHRGEAVPVRTLDSFELPACHLLKVDVEGMELEVVRGAEETIRKHRPIVYAEYHPTAQSKGMVDFLKSLGYRLYHHDPPVFNPSNYFGNPDNHFRSGGDSNLLGVHASLRANLTGFEEIT